MQQHVNSMAEFILVGSDKLDHSPWFPGMRCAAQTSADGAALVICAGFNVSHSIVVKQMFGDVIHGPPEAIGFKKSKISRENYLVVAIVSGLPWLIAGKK